MKTCGNRFCRCVCGLPEGHEGWHECGDKYCRGQWNVNKRRARSARGPNWGPLVRNERTS